jgi:hypothetical protein
MLDEIKVLFPGISEYFMAYEARKVYFNAIYKQIYAYFTHRHITEACSAVGSSF